MDADAVRNLQKLVDLEEIRALKHRYAELCDDGYDGAKIAALFAPDAVWDGGMFGRYEGREKIRDHFNKSDRAVPFAIHLLSNELIEVDGDRATASWLLWEPMVFAPNDLAIWMSARYRDTYRRIDGKWMFQTVTINVQMFSPYETGFGRQLLTELPR